MKNIILISILLATSTLIANAQTRLDDSLALVELYDSTGGIGWKYQWDLLQPMDVWSGVAMTNGRVTCLDLDGTPSCKSENTSNNLFGILPNLKLSELQFLNLSHNQLFGRIPNFTHLDSLKYLDLHWNDLTDTIPNFSNLGNLEYLNLVGNQLTGEIPNFPNFNKLQHLNLAGNDLTGLIPNFQNLNAIKFLNLGYNYLYGLIPDFSNLGNLDSLYLNRNGLTGSIPNFSNLGSLKLLTLDDNQLSNTIPNFSNLSSLEVLILADNNLTGGIPNFTNLDSLKHLILSQNPIKDTIPNFSNLPKLIRLGLWECQLTGLIPDFSNLPSLQDLNLYKNKLTLAVPDFSNLPNLLELHLAENELIGVIPDFSNLEKLDQLRLNENQLYGPIPDFTNLKNLRYLVLNDNELTGNIPNFSNLLNLYSLLLKDNQLYDTIPNFTHLETLSGLDLSNNYLEGEIPDFSNLLSIRNVDLSFNNLEGEIPNISNLPLLVSLKFNNNELSGSIPDFLNLTNIHYLDMSFNYLNGTIPNFSNLLNLSYLYLDNNNFTSTIPSFTNLIDLGNLKLYNNELTFEDLIDSRHYNHVLCSLYSSNGLYDYFIQDSIGLREILSTSAGSPYSISLHIDDTVTTNIYNWFKDSTLFATTSMNALNFPSIHSSHSGVYYCQITNPNVPGLTLFSRAKTLIVPCSISAFVTTINTTCSFDNGILSTSVSGATGSYTILWSNSETTATISNLPPGDYSVTITDVNGCFDTASSTVVGSKELSLGISGDLLNCHGDTNGEISVTVEEGLPPFNYIWNSPLISGSNGSSLPSGTYAVTVSDSFGCIGTISTDVLEPSSLNVIGSISQPTCQVMLGSINLSTAGGSDCKEAKDLFISEYLEGHLNNRCIEIYNGTGAEIDLLSDDWELHIYPAGNTISISYDLIGTIKNNETQLICNGASNIDPILATLADQFFSGGYNGNDAIVLQNNGGTLIDVFGNIGCFPGVSWTGNTNTTKNIVLRRQPTIDSPIEIDPGNSPCDFPTLDTEWTNAPLTDWSDLGSHTYIGNPQPPSYSWSNGATTKDISGLSPGMYTVTVTDCKGCVAIQTFTINTPLNNISINVVSSGISSTNPNDGYINLSSSGGASPYTYLWSNGSTTPNISGLGEGTYIASVTDANNCSVVESVDLFAADSFNVQIAINDTIICHSSSDGSIIAIPSGGQPPYSFLWTTGETTDLLTQLSSGTFGVTITDANGNTATNNVLLTEPDPTILSGFIYSNQNSTTCPSNGLSYSAIVYITYSKIEFYVNGELAQDSVVSSFFSFDLVNNDTITVRVYDEDDCLNLFLDTAIVDAYLQPEISWCNAKNDSVQVVLTQGTPTWSFDLLEINDSDTITTNYNEVYNSDTFFIKQPSTEYFITNLLLDSNQCIFSTTFHNSQILGCEYICVGYDSSHTEVYTAHFLSPATNYLWGIEPLSAITDGDINIVSGQGSNSLMISFPNPNTTHDTIILTVSADTDCGKEYLSYQIILDKHCVWPGDINNDGQVKYQTGVSWVDDAIALGFARNKYDGYNNSQNNTSLISHPRHNNCFGLPLWEWVPQYGQDWKYIDTIGSTLNATFNIEDSIGINHWINLKYADSNGDEEIDFKANWNPFIDSINFVPDPTDHDIVVYHAYNNAAHFQNTNSFGNPNEYIKIVTPDSVYNSGDEIVFSVRIGDIGDTIKDISQVAFIAEGAFGSFKQPTVNILKSHLVSNDNEKVDYPFLLNDYKGNPRDSFRWHIALARENGTGVSFYGQEICEVVCVATPAQFHNSYPLNNSFSPVDSIPITLRISAGGIGHSDNSIEYTISNEVTVWLRPEESYIDAKVNLGGAYFGATKIMRDDLSVSNWVPMVEPYTQHPEYFTPQKNMKGISIQDSLSVLAHRGDTIIDWVFIEIRDKIDTNIIGARPALLKRNGKIVDVDGVSPVRLYGVPKGYYYVMIRHRNHLPVMTTVPIELNASSHFDFTEGEDTTLQMGDVNSGYAMYPGDVDGDYVIGASDRSYIWNKRNTIGYLLADINLDGTVNASDRSIVWNYRNKFVFLPK